MQEKGVHKLTEGFFGVEGKQVEQTVKMKIPVLFFILDRVGKWISNFIFEIESQKNPGVFSPQATNPISFK